MMREGQDITGEKKITVRIEGEEDHHHMRKGTENAEDHPHLHHRLQNLQVHLQWDHHLLNNHQISREKLRKSD